MLLQEVLFEVGRHYAAVEQVMDGRGQQAMGAMGPLVMDEREMQVGWNSRGVEEVDEEKLGRWLVERVLRVLRGLVLVGWQVKSVEAPVEAIPGVVKRALEEVLWWEVYLAWELRAVFPSWAVLLRKKIWLLDNNIPEMLTKIVLPSRL